MDSRGLDPPHLVGKIGYQGIRSYVTAADSTLWSEEKSNEPPLGASSQYQANGSVVQLGERRSCKPNVVGSNPTCIH